MYDKVELIFWKGETRVAHTEIEIIHNPDPLDEITAEAARIHRVLERKKAEKTNQLEDNE